MNQQIQRALKNREKTIKQLMSERNFRFAIRSIFDLMYKLHRGLNTL